METVSEIIVKTLRSMGVQTVFGIPSIHNIGFYEALRKEPHIRHILCRHEASATHMADGYARSGKGPGVVVTSTGPGAAYSLSPLLEAFYSCSPVLMMTSNLRENQIGKGLGALHEVNRQHDLFESVTKETICLKRGDSITEKVSYAVSTAISGRPGPVYLEVPHDLWDVEIDETTFSNREKRNAPYDLAGAKRLLKKAITPMIIVGIEAMHAGMAAEIQVLAEILHAPVLTDAGAKGILPEDHPLAFGNVTNGGVVKTIHKTCDVTLSIGSRLRYVDFKRRGISLPQLIHFDWDETWVDKNFKSTITCIGPVKEMVGMLINEFKRIPVPRERHDTVNRFRGLHRPLSEIPDEHAEISYLRALRDAIPRNGMLVIDNTLLGYFAEQFYPSYKPLGIVPAKGATPIGFAFPAAIGLKAAYPEEPVVSLIGDGGFLYGAVELATCLQHGIGFPVVVVNDRAYGMIDYLQHSLYGAGYQTSLFNPDFSAFALSFGAKARAVDTPDGLKAALKEALASPEMWLIELNASFPDPPFGKY